MNWVSRRKTSATPTKRRDISGELLITILSSQVQEESRNLNEHTRWGIVRNFGQGLVHINHKSFMGYTKDDENLIQKYMSLMS